MIRYGRKVLITSIIILLLVSLNTFFDILNSFTFIPFLFTLLFGTIFLFSFDKDKFRYKTDIMFMVFISCFIYYILIYFVGLFLGYTRNLYTMLSFSFIIQNIISMTTIIILYELIRYNLIKKARNKISTIIIITISLILIDISLLVDIYRLDNTYKIVEFILGILIPTIFKHIYLSFSTKRLGYKPSIIYNLLMSIPIYFIPITPDLGGFAEAVFKIILPSFLFLITFIITNKKITPGIAKRNKGRILPYFILIIGISFIILNTGWFKYHALAIATGSMEPNISIGDIVIVEKINEENLDILNVDDVLVYRKEGEIIVHRIVEIRKEDNIFIFYTKGDANNDLDNYTVRNEEIIGKTSTRIRYIGIPTVWLSRRIGAS